MSVGSSSSVPASPWGARVSTWPRKSRTRLPETSTKPPLPDCAPPRALMSAVVAVDVVGPHDHLAAVARRDRVRPQRRVRRRRTCATRSARPRSCPDSRRRRGSCRRRSRRTHRLHAPSSRPTRLPRIWTVPPLPALPVASILPGDQREVARLDRHAAAVDAARGHRRAFVDDRFLLRDERDLVRLRRRVAPRRPDVAGVTQRAREHRTRSSPRRSCRR